MSSASVYVWDMDHTIINNDCDVSWKQFLVDTGVVPPDVMGEVDRFYQQYTDNVLDVDEFLRFQLKEFTERSVAEIRTLCDEHFNAKVKHTIYRSARELINAQKKECGRLVLLTATNRYIAEPLAEYLGFQAILATEPERDGDGFTGGITGEYCMRDGKVTHLKRFCEESDVNLDDVSYYGDSTSDIPVMEVVGHPHVCNPMPALKEVALERNWPVLQF